MSDNRGPNVNALLEKLQQLEGMMAAFEQQQQQAAPAPPPIGVAHRPHIFYRNRSVIVAPDIDRDDYEINLKLIQLVERKPFCGIPSENPMEHIEKIERICNTTKARGVPQDYIRCKIFEFSLADKASRWLNSLTPQSLVGWPAVRNAFLDHYFTRTKTVQLRAKISGFQQHLGESFYDAWLRFKIYQRDCPHHGISESELLNIFYDGVAREYKLALNVASNGNFMTRSVVDGTNLINNFAESYYDMSTEFELNEASYVSGHMSKQGYNFNYMNSQDEVYPPLNKYFYADQDFRSFQGQYHGHYQLPVIANQAPMRQYQAPYQSPKENLQDELKSMMQMLLTNQQKLACDINVKVDDMYNDLNRKFDALSSHVKKLDTQVAQTTEAIRRQPHILPERLEENPQVEHAEAITLRSDTLPQHHENTLETTEVSNLITSDSNTNSSSFAKTCSTKALVSRSVFKQSGLRPFTTPHEKHDYIPKVSYPAAPYKPKIFQRHISSVAICSNVKTCSPEPTHHTMPWFEESYLHNRQLSC